MAKVGKASLKVKLMVLVTTARLMRWPPGKQGQMMPARPVHAAAFQGAIMRLEVTWQGGKPSGVRARMLVHDNDYVGTLRRKVAAKMNVQPACVRLLSNGAPTTRSPRSV